MQRKEITVVTATMTSGAGILLVVLINLTHSHGRQIPALLANVANMLALTPSATVTATVQGSGGSSGVSILPWRLTSLSRLLLPSLQRTALQSLLLVPIEVWKFLTLHLKKSRLVQINKFSFIVIVVGREVVAFDGRAKHHSSY